MSISSEKETMRESDPYLDCRASVGVAGVIDGFSMETTGVTALI